MRIKILILLIIGSVLGSLPIGAKGITVGMALEPPHLDITSSAAGAIREVLYANVYEGLTKFTKTGSIVPCLATSWSVFDDGKKYRFKLKTGVMFHDGKNFTADDVKFTLDRAKAEGSTNAQKHLFRSIKEVIVVDSYTVDIELKYKDGALPTKLAWGDAVILGRNSSDDLKNQPIGTGPFKFYRWIKGDRIMLNRINRSKSVKTNLESIVFRFISDPNAAIAALITQDIDYFPSFPAPEVLGQFLTNKKFTVDIGITEGETILAINNSKKPFNNINIRKAITHAIDRKSVIDGAMFGYAAPISSHYPPGRPNTVDLFKLSQYDPELSKKLIKEAGYLEGFSVNLVLPPPQYAKRSGEIIAAFLRKVGIKVNIENVEWALWLEKVFKNKDYDLTIVAHTEPNDLDIYARDDYYFGYINPNYKRLIDKLEVSYPEADRVKLVKEAQTLLAKDYVNVFLFELPKIGIYRAGIKGLWKDAPTQAIDLTSVIMP